MDRELIALWHAFLAVFLLLLQATVPAGAQQSSSNYFTVNPVALSDGTGLEETIINGPPVPPPGFAVERQSVSLPEPNSASGVNTLMVPAFNWVFGCSAVSGAMIAGYYDRSGWPNMYTGPTNGGVMPSDNSSWPTWSDGSTTYPSCPLIASKNGVDGRLTRGSIDDYWVQYNSSANDPYITGSWTQHTWGDAIGDYMKTSQSAYSNIDGSTSFWTYSSNPNKLTCAAMSTYGITNDGTKGRALFYGARGYIVTDCYNQKTDNTISGGFSFANFKAEIDAGRPVMLNLAGHTVVGIGYNDAINLVYLHDTWDYLTHTMAWGTSYAGMALLSVSIVNLSPSVCGSGVSLKTGIWQMLALPCVPAAPSTIASTLGANTTGQLNATIYGNAGAGGWLMYGNDVVNDKNLKLAVTDNLANTVGYWIKSFSAPAAGGKLTVSGTPTIPDVTAAGGCVSSLGCKAITVTTVSGNNRFNLVGNPFPYGIPWVDVRVRVGGVGGTVYTPSQAAGIATSGNAVPPVMDNKIWIWEDTSYATYDDVTLGMLGNLPYFSAFWVKVLPGAAGQIVELLIPASNSPLAQAAPTAERVVGWSQPWYLGWLDWLISPAAADDEFAPGHHPTDILDRSRTPQQAQSSSETVFTTTFDLLTAEGIAQGLTPDEAVRAAHTQAVTQGREWYVRLKVNEPATGYKDYNSVLGQLLTAQDGYDSADLIELPPFAKPYLTLVFPHPTWGDQAGNYASDFRSAQRVNGNNQPQSGLPAADWPFEIRADRPGTQVILRWEGDPTIIKNSRLLDLATRKIINLTAPTYADGYPVTLTTGTRAFTWQFLGQR